MKVKTGLLIFIVAVLSATATYLVIANCSELSAAKLGVSKTEAESSSVKISGLKTMLAVAGDGWNTINLTGKITVPSDRLVKISPRIAGKVVAAYPKVGDAVRQGQTIAIISSVELAEARSQYRQALARLDTARKSLNQELQMVQLGAMSIRPLEEARADKLDTQGGLSDAKSELLQAKSELVRAESELTRCKTRLERQKELYADQIVSKQDVETAEADFKIDTAAMEAAKSKTSQAETRIEMAKARADIAQQYYAREEKVYKGKLVDTRAVQSAKSEVASAKNELQAAADRIRVLGANPEGTGETIAITCPISGRVVSRNTNIGEMASPSDILFTVANLSKVWTEADVYEKDIAKVHKGQTVEIKVDAYPERVFSGRVDSIGDMLSPDSRTAKLRCIVNNSQGLLKGEMFAQVTLITSRSGSTVLIPKQAVLDEAGKKIVFTTCMECPIDKLKGPSACGEYDKAVITTGPIRGNQIEVLNGITPGTEVVTVGQNQIKSALSTGQLKAGCKDDCEE